MNHVFVDFENVHHVDLSLVGNKAMSLTLLLGANQTKLNADLVEKLIEHAASVQLVRLPLPGKNALDFALSYYLGRAVLADPKAHFHVVSKDTGFDSLIEHLRSRHIRARRHDDFATLSFSGLGKPASAPPEDLLTRVLAHLRKNAANRPKSKKTLERHLLTFTAKTDAEADIPALIETLCRSRHIGLGDKDAVRYLNLDPRPIAPADPSPNTPSAGVGIPIGPAVRRPVIVVT